MMSSPSTKRRKLVSTAARKPFKSPGPQGKLFLNESDGHDRSALPDSTKHKSALSKCAVSPSRPTGLLAFNRTKTKPTLPVYPKTESSLTSLAATAISEDVSLGPVRSLQSSYQNRLNHLDSLRRDLDNTLQAARLASCNRDIELEQLIHSWTVASRAAAEELLGIAKDRVNGMGGLAAWHERESERHARFQSDMCEDHGCPEKDDIEHYRNYNSLHGEPPEMGRENCDQGFTMELMLGTLNIALETIGWDAKMQQWKD